MSTVTEATSLFIKYESTLNEAVAAVHSRKFYAKYPEPPSGKIYGETSNDEGKAKFDKQLNQNYSGLLQEHSAWLKAEEQSPYTMEKLGISYPVSTNIEDYITRSQTAALKWKKATAEDRAGLLVESLERIRNRFFELAYATMHTTGQAFVMSFQASGPHSNDRALEAIAMGLHEQTRFPREVEWVKPMGKMEVKLRKFYKVVPRGINLLIGCSTFPVWNTVPGLFAGLVTGNTAIVKPHPLVIYPIALVVEELQKVLKENGYDPQVVQLACDSPATPITKKLSEHPSVKLIDFTGSSQFGGYVESIQGKKTFTEKAGINSMVLESANDLKAMMDNIAFSLSLFSGQMCTCPQNIFIPEDGITVAGNKISYADTIQALADSVRGLVTHEKMGPGTLGAIQSDITFNRVKEAQAMGMKVILESLLVSNPEFPKARIATPTIIEVPNAKKEIYEKEMFGPIVFVIPVKNAEEGVALAKTIAINHGAITFSAYTTDLNMQQYMIDEMSESFTSVSFNFTGPIWVNQSAGGKGL